MAQPKRNKEKVRPHTRAGISKVSNLQTAKRWRQSLIKDIEDRHSKMFDPLLGQEQLKEYNDQLNQWIKELKWWDWHIRNKLHGNLPEAARNHRNKLYMHLGNGKLVLGKRYYGRAIELPEIKDHLDKQEKKRFQVERLIDLKRVNLNNKNYTTTPEALLPDLKSFEEHWTPLLQTINHVPLEETKLNPFKSVSQTDMESWLVQRRKKRLIEGLNL